MNLKQIEHPAVYRLTGYLEAVSDFIRSGELKWFFDVRLFEIDGRFTDIKSLVKAAYPGSSPDTATIMEGTIQDLVETLKHELGRGLQPIEALKILTPVTEFQGEMWRYMEECIGYDQARIFEYYNSDMLDGFYGGGILSNIAAVILNEKQKRCLFFSGGDCD